MDNLWSGCRAHKYHDSVCRSVLQSPQDAEGNPNLLEVEDLSKDPRFAHYEPVQAAPYVKVRFMFMLHWSRMFTTYQYHAIVLCGTSTTNPKECSDRRHLCSGSRASRTHESI